MAEVLATMVVGPLLSMVKDKASSYLLDQYKVMEGMEEQHKLLKRKLPAVLDVIADAEEQAAKHREGAKAWLEEVRMVAYKANDVLDEFKYEALRRKARKEGHYKELGMDVIKLFPSHNRFVFRYKMAKKLQMILQELDVLITEMNTFRFEFKPQPAMSLKCRQTDPYISSHAVKIASESRAKEKQEVVDKLLHRGSDEGLTVLPIFGIGGMGKTTLAQLVYNDTTIQKHFQVRLWVCVSENFDVDSLVQKIVEATKENGCEVKGNSALEKLQNALSGKRYLLVLDDVWNRDPNKWKKLKSHLPHGGNGSSVLTTTRDAYIAKDIMGTIEAHQIKGLEEKFIVRIIETTAFSSQAERPDPRRKMVGDVGKRCCGSPLAATALGYVLRTKNTVHEWEAVLRRNTICDEENGILPILKLSYNCLSPHMRQCFAFCAMFPKDYEIDVKMLIQLWMANGFISEQQGECPELVGENVFTELTQRSFFQEVKQVTFESNSSSRLTCKIHDLMHDVAQNSMGKECATIDTKLSPSGDFAFSARHLFVSFPEVVLNASQKKGSPTIQTLICDRGEEISVQDLSKFKSIRALMIRQGSLLEVKYLHHLRYLDLSFSSMKELPEDITILYHLQTLNLSNCDELERLPKAMKYMTALRHLYTNECDHLKSMPAGLGNLTSLQTLTWYVAGTVPGCSNVGELGTLDLGGQLELRQLQNVTGADAKAAQLRDKKRLEELKFTWSGNNSSSDKEKHKEVLECLEPHDELKAMSIVLYRGATIPTWILNLKDMVTLTLYGCENLEKLPALWKLPGLQFLHVSLMGNLHCLFSGGTPSKFRKLKSMSLSEMPEFETWWDTNEVPEGEPIFPEVEKLEIEECPSLTALPRAAVIKESPECRSAFPSLREMVLKHSKMLCRWEEAAQGSPREHQVTFPQLEELAILDCPEILNSYPEAPKLGKLEVWGGSDETPLLEAARRYYITSLSCLALANSTAGATLQQANRKNRIGLVERDMDEWNDNTNKLFPMEYLHLIRCNVFFSGLSAAPALWTYFGQLVLLKIWSCDDVVHWPEKAFQGLESLRTLDIYGCSKLTGESAPAGRSGGPLLPRLESLVISECESLVEVPKLPASLKTLRITACNGLRGSMVFSGQRRHLEEEEEEEEEDTRRRLVNGEGIIVVAPDMMSSVIPAGSSTTAVPFPCLESLTILGCSALSEVTNLPTSIKTLEIDGSTVPLPLGELPSLEDLTIGDGGSSSVLPPSLKTLRISGCSKVKSIEFGGQQQEETATRLVNSSTSSSIMAAGSSSANASSTAALVMKLSSPPNLESLTIWDCSALSEVANLPPSIKTLKIRSCNSLGSLLGELPSYLQDLIILSCPSLRSLPNGPQGAYSSLRVLEIYDCNDLRRLPIRLRQRLAHLERKDLDPRLVDEGSTITQGCATLMSKLKVPSRLRRS